MAHDNNDNLTPSGNKILPSCTNHPSASLDLFGTSEDRTVSHEQHDGGALEIVATSAWFGPSPVAVAELRGTCIEVTALQRPEAGS